MSGGSYEYAYEHFEDFARRVTERADGNPLRLALAEQARKMARAAHALEWVDSNDWAAGDEVAPIMAAIPKDGELRAALALAETAAATLAEEIEHAKERLEKST